MEKTLREYNWSISVSRITATILILMCHLCAKIGLGWLGNIFDVGVPMFLIISGFLYGGGNSVSDIKGFYVKRWCRICIPMYIWLILVVSIHCLQGNFHVLKAVPIFIFNLQGMGWIQDFVVIPSIGDIGILWFLTVIYICYLFVPAINFYFERIDRSIWFKGLLIGIIFLLNYAGLHLGYILTFLIGYWAGKKGIYIRVKKHLIIFLISTLICQFFRLLMRKYFDDTIFYNYIVVYISHTSLACFFLAVIDNIVYLFRKTDRFLKSYQSLIRKLDNLSMYIYIVHYTFLTGVLAVNKWIPFRVFWIPLWIIETVIGAIILKKLSDLILHRLLN